MKSKVPGVFRLLGSKVKLWPDPNVNVPSLIGSEVPTIPIAFALARARRKSPPPVGFAAGRLARARLSAFVEDLLASAVRISPYEASTSPKFDWPNVLVPGTAAIVILTVIGSV